MGRYLLAMAQLHQCQYLSTVAPEEQAKRYKIICKRLGLDVKIVNDITIQDRPYYNQIEMKLLLCNITRIPDFRNLISK